MARAAANQPRDLTESLWPLSTRQQPPRGVASVVAPLLDKLTRPFLLAGGISADNRSEYEKLVAHPLFLGIDVDTNARGPDGKVDGARVDAITRAWRAPEPEESR